MNGSRPIFIIGTVNNGQFCLVGRESLVPKLIARKQDREGSFITKVKN